MSAGSVFKRCGCTTLVDGKRKQLGARCPKLRRGDGWNPRHGRWAFAISIVGKGGRRQQVVRSGFATQAEAQTAMDTVRGQVARGATIPSAKLTVGTYLSEWLDSRSDLRPSTRRAYASHIRVYWAPLVGHVRLVDLRREHVAAALAEVPGSDANRQRVRATLRAALSDAEDQGLVAKNAAKVKLTSGKRPRALAWTPERVEAWQATGNVPGPVMVWMPEHLGAFLDHAEGDRLYPLFLLMSHCGVRRGEACGLRWEDVSLDRNRAMIRRQLVQDGWSVHEGPPKSEAGQRTIALDETLVAALQVQRKTQLAERMAWGPAYVDTGYCFSREDGAPLHPAAVTVRFQQLVADAGLPPSRLHDLRHCSASLQHAAGKSMKEIQVTLGHGTFSLTSDTYTTLFDEVDVAGAEATAAVIPRAVASGHADTGVVTSLSHHESARSCAALRRTESPIYKGFRSGAPGARTQNPRIKSQDDDIPRGDS